MTAILKKGISIVRNEKIMSLLSLIALTSLISMTFMREVIPPQMGWWNYYGWQVYEGKTLYKDLFCFVPPTYVWVMAFLYSIFSTHILWYQLLGIIMFDCLGVLFFLMLYRVGKPILSMIAVSGGIAACLMAPYMIFFDYTTFLMFFVYLSCYFLVVSIERNDYRKYLFTLLSGISFGIAFMTKQTMIPFIVFALVILMFCYFSRMFSRKTFLVRTCWFFLGMLVTIAPQIYYLFETDSMSLFLSQTFGSAAAKGMTSSYIDTVANVFRRFYSGGFSWVEFFLAILLCICFLWGNLKKRIDNFLSPYAIPYAIFCAVLFKFYRNVICFDHSWIAYFVYIGFALNSFLLLYWQLRQRGRIPLGVNLKYFDPTRFSSLVSFIGLAFFIILIREYGGDFDAQILSNNVIPQFSRSICAISFYISFFYVTTFIVSFYRSRRESIVFENVEWPIFILVIYSLVFYFTVLLSTPFIELLYCIPGIAFFLLILEEHDRVSRCIAMLLVVLLTFITIGSKQISAYSWHGFSMSGISDSKVKHVPSRVDGLQGYSIDVDTEIGYENVTKAINMYSTVSDNVYEFPHITLFNVITNRRQGTYAVSHFIDVCPDYILQQDLEKVKADSPNLIIWNDMPDSVWSSHEDYFRSGHRSVIRDYIAWYDKVITEEYSCLYRFRNIYVWAKEPDTKKNLDLAIARLNSVIYYYGDDEMKDAMSRVSAEDYQELYASEIPYSVGECMAYVISHTPELDNLLDDAFYEHLIPEAQGEKMRQLKSTAVEDVGDEDENEEKQL